MNDEIESGEYEGGFKSVTVNQVVADLNASKTQYHTTTQLQRCVAAKTGKPCNSRNRPVLLKKLGMQETGKPGTVVDAGGPDDYDKIGKALRAATAPANVARITKKLNGKRPGKPKPNKVAKGKRASAPADLRAIALKAVTAAMARKSPPSLRALCAELKERKIQKPRGGLDWLPSSVQSLMRQASVAKGK